MFQELLYANVSKIPFHETSTNGVIWGKASQDKISLGNSELSIYLLLEIPQNIQCFNAFSEFT